MKALFNFNLFFLLSSFGLYCQVCPEGDLILSNQEMVDQFLVDYPDCTKVNGNLCIGLCYDNFPNNSGIMDLSPLANLVQIQDSLIIQNNQDLHSLSGLENLVDINGAIDIINNFFLQETSAIQPLVNKSNRIYMSQNGLKQLDLFAGLDTIKTNVSLSGMIELKSLKGLEDIKVIQGNFSLTSSDRIQNIDQLSNLELVEGYLWFMSLDSLKNLDGLSSLEEVNGNIQLIYNRQLVNIEGMNNLKRANTLHLAGLPSLLSLTGLENLEEIENTFVISSINNITNLDPLENVIKVGNKLIIASCDNIQDISGLRNINSELMTPSENSPNLKISNNPKLSNCSIESVCQIIQNEFLTTEIQENENHCNTEDEILAMCTVNVNEETFSKQIVVYPNPTDGILSFSNLTEEIKDVIVVNTIGERVIVPVNNSKQLDLNGFANGLYSIIAVLPTQSQSFKILKI